MTAHRLPDRPTQRIIEIKNSKRVNSVLFTDDGKQVLSGDEEGMLRRWRVDDGQEVGEPFRAIGEIYAAALSPDGKWLASGFMGFPLKLPFRTVSARVWNARTHEKVLDIKGHADTVFSVDISPDSTKLATGSGDKTVFIWDIATGERLVGPLQHDYDVVAVQFSPHGRRKRQGREDSQVDSHLRQQQWPAPSTVRHPLYEQHNHNIARLDIGRSSALCCLIQPSQAIRHVLGIFAQTMVSFWRWMAWFCRSITQPKACCRHCIQITLVLGHIYAPANRYCYRTHKRGLVDCPFAKRRPDCDRGAERGGHPAEST